ncbi:MAG: VOC family protein [Chitinophagaceae bacterium]|nr:MAG: VOC family protein [Chitinophagaceae bacterium]
MYKVNDLQKAKKWYAEAFGVAPYFDESFYVGFDIGGFELGLQPTNDEADSNLANVVAYLGVRDVASAYARIIELGAVSFESPREVGGGIVVAVAKDPWGNALGLIYNPHFGDGNG